MKYTFNPLTNRFDAFATTLSPTGEIDFLTGDSGGAVPPDGSQNLNLIGGNSVVTTGTPGTSTISIKNMADNTKYVVDPRAGETNYQTIQSAIDAAYADYLVSGLPQTVFIRNGTYTENLTHYVNVNLVSDNALQTIIIGQNTISITGNVCFSNITFQYVGDNLFLGSGNLINATFNNCVFDTKFSIFRIGTLSGDITLNNCFCDNTNNAFVYNPQGTTNFNIFNSRFIGNTIYTSQVGDATHIGGDYLFVNSEFNYRVEFTNGGTVEIYNSIIKDELYGIVGSSGGYNFYVENSYLFANRSSDSGSCITGNGAVITIINSTIDATGSTVNNYAISGSGTLTLDSVTFVRATAINPALTISTPSLFETGSLKLSATTTGALSAASGVVSAGTLTVGNGGIGTNTLTSHGVLMGNGASAIQATAEPTDGQILIGKTGDFPQLATLTAGTNVSITNGAGAITIASAGILAYSEVTDATKAMAVNSSYGANRGGGVAFSLPATAAIGTEIEIVGIAGLWSITQAANQYVKFGNQSSSVGAGGSWTATDAGDCVKLKCIVADLGWRVVSSTGNPNPA